MTIDSVSDRVGFVHGPQWPNCMVGSLRLAPISVLHGLYAIITVMGEFPLLHSPSTKVFPFECLVVCSIVM